MTEFRGKFEYTIDSKGRVNIPAKFRKSINPQADETFVITRAFSGCLRAYPLDEWRKVTSELESRPENPETIKFKRKIYSTLFDYRLDAQGRIMLTAEQIRLSGISKDVTLVGMGAYVEIWAPDRYKEYLGDQDDQAEFDQLFARSVELASAAKK